MPKPKVSFDLKDTYSDAKTLRSSNTNKRYRRLRKFERCYYKKICEVTKTGHNLTQEHNINDGNLGFHPVHSITYSLNKKKRWLLPDLIQRRILDNENNDKKYTELKKQDQTKTVNDQLKIVMYENNNIKYHSTCLRYCNNKTEPRVIEPKYHQYFNSETLTSWINFSTRTHFIPRGQRRRRRTNNNNPMENDVDPNTSNFGIQQRPGFFHSEVTYKFLYPYRPSNKFDSDNESSRCNIGTKRSCLRYSTSPHQDRYSMTKHVPKVHKRIRLNYAINDELSFDVYDGDDDLKEHDYVFISNNSNEEEESLVYISEKDAEYDSKLTIDDEEIISDQFPSLCYPISSFIDNKRSHSSECIVSMNDDLSIFPDYKSNKVYGVPEYALYQDDVIKEKQPRQIVCSSSFSKLHTIIYDVQEFLNCMKQHHKYIKQANIYPPTFLQQYDVVDDELVQIFYIYENTYCDIYMRIENDLKTKNSRLISDLVNQIASSVDCLTSIINHVQNFLSLFRNENENTFITVSTTTDMVKETSGSLKLPLSVSSHFSTVRPNSTNKEIALKALKILFNDETVCFDTNVIQEKVHDCCSICLELFTEENRVYCLLPCQHCICAECLQNYIQISLQTLMFSSSSINITCFYSKCSTILNNVTLKRFLSLQLYKRLCDYSNEKRLFSLNIYRYCRSKLCSKLMIIDKEKRFDGAMCSCGERICLKCSEEWHWPATCEQYKNYSKRLKASGDHLLTSEGFSQLSTGYIAEGKHCPSCGSFCEKNGGCMHMSCICGGEYCWTCLQRWQNHSYDTCSYIQESTYELKLSNRNRLYNLAVKYRHARNQYHIERFLTLIRSYDNKILTKNLYNEIIALYIDINTIAEFLCVSLHRKRIQNNIRFVLGQTAKKFDAYSLRLQLYVEDYKILNQNLIEQIQKIRFQVNQTFKNLAYMKYHDIF